MSLITDLTNIPQREKGGSTALDRLDFQTTFGLDELLRRHVAPGNYGIAFEFHDDIVVLDDVGNPGSITTYQLKTDKSKKWTIARLTSRKAEPGTNKKGPSIAAKMYDNRVKFGHRVQEVYFVSNQPCDFIDQDKYPCSFSNGSPDSVSEFEAAMKAEIPAFKDVDTKLFHYDQTSFGLNEYSNYILGRIVNFLADHCSVQECNHRAFYLGVYDQCRNKSKFLKDVVSYDQLIAAKFVARNDFDQWINDLKLSLKTRPKWSSVQASNSGYTFQELAPIRIQWRNYEAMQFSTDFINLALWKKEVRKRLDQPSVAYSSIKMMIDTESEALKDTAKLRFGHYDRTFVQAALLYEYLANE
ncbi:dsDNA nuclease domain-containing protein [Methylobacterium sp. P1-11]|uniref:dsDNA nuclease domain-containing protein n=1 Tax=Methylobacterium sp. P1-11 TaxID=2024616 RepID=UPI001564B5B7|nr:dsDNA nuclease domain-containing protein [Methylobacterium sp. P1-11]